MRFSEMHHFGSSECFSNVLIKVCPRRSAPLSRSLVFKSKHFGGTQRKCLVVEFRVISRCQRVGETPSPPTARGLDGVVLPARFATLRLRRNRRAELAPQVFRRSVTRVVYKDAVSLDNP